MSSTTNGGNAEDNEAYERRIMRGFFQFCVVVAIICIVATIATR